MVFVQSDIKRGFLRSIYRQNAVAGDIGALLPALNAFQDGGFLAIKSGRLIVDTSANGKRTTFALPNIATRLTQDQIFALSEQLLQIYSDALVTLSAQSIDSPTDTQILNTMLGDDRLQTVREQQMDSTLLRFPTNNPGAVSP